MKFKQTLNESGIVWINDFLKFYKEHPKMIKNIEMVTGEFGSKITWKEALKYVENILGKDYLNNETFLSKLKSLINPKYKPHQNNTKRPKWHPTSL